MAAARVRPGLERSSPRHVSVPRGSYPPCPGRPASLGVVAAAASASRRLPPGAGVRPRELAVHRLALCLQPQDHDPVAGEPGLGGPRLERLVSAAESAAAGL